MRWYPAASSSARLNAESAAPSAARPASRASWSWPHATPCTSSGCQRAKKEGGVMLWWSTTSGSCRSCTKSATVEPTAMWYSNTVPSRLPRPGR